MNIWNNGLLLGVAAVSALLGRDDDASLLEPTADQPRQLYSVGAAYDAGRERLIVFGGYFRGSYSGDTWEWDGRGWQRHDAGGPSPRNGPAMVYDEHNRYVLLFGGDTRTDGEFGDTWAYGVEGWAQLADSGPDPRTGHSMVYDSHRRTVVLFGGFAEDRGLDDTWEWDGERWRRVAEGGPSPRGLAAMAYDRSRRRAVLFGGLSDAVPGARSLGDTWEWDGDHWIRIDVAGPGPRDHMAMTFDRLRSTVILHEGGQLGRTANSETWSYDGRRWALISVAGPPRLFPRMVFDTSTGAPLLYGGFTREGPTNGIWHLIRSGWRRSFPPDRSAPGD